jgi:hypothetical protein
MLQMKKVTYSSWTSSKILKKKVKVKPIEIIRNPTSTVNRSVSNHVTYFHPKKKIYIEKIHKTDSCTNPWHRMWFSWTVWEEKYKEKHPTITVQFSFIYTVPVVVCKNLPLTASKFSWMCYQYKSNSYMVPVVVCKN